MSNPHIRTKWQYVLPLINEDEVYMTAAKDHVAVHWRKLTQPDPDKLRDFIADLSELPRFCIDPELLKLCEKEEFMLSLMDMKKAGVLRLPFPAMMVELEHTDRFDRGVHSMVLLRDARHEGFFPWEQNPGDKKHLPFFEVMDMEGGADFYGVRMSIEKDDDGHYFTISPSVVVAAVYDPQDVDQTKVDPKTWAKATMEKKSEKAPWIKFGGEGHTLWPHSPALNEHVEATYMKDAGTCFYAAASAYLLMSSAGVHKEVVTCERMNRKRVADGRVPIPRHTYVYIGRVYRSDSSDQTDAYIPRKSPRPHWRRGHLKNVRYGEGRLLTKPKFIPGRIVAYKGDAVPKAPQYTVSE